jgi:nitrate/nitrite transporter NarK
VVGVWVFFYLDPGIDDARWLSREEKALLKHNLAAEEQSKQVRLRDAFQHPLVWLFALVYGGLMIGLYGVAFWLPTIIARTGVSGYLQTGLLTAIPYGVAVVAMVALGRSSDLTGERRWHATAAFCAGAVGLCFSSAFPQNQFWSLLFLSLGTAGILSAMPLFWTLPTSFLSGTAAAAGIGLINSFGNLGGYIGPNIPVWAKQAGLPPAAPLCIIGGGLFIAALMVLASAHRARPNLPA